MLPAAAAFLSLQTPTPAQAPPSHRKTRIVSTLLHVLPDIVRVRILRRQYIGYPPLPPCHEHKGGGIAECQPDIEGLVQQAKRALVARFEMRERSTDSRAGRVVY